MLLLFESPAGFALFKVLDEKKLKEVEVRPSLLAKLLIVVPMATKPGRAFGGQPKTLLLPIELVAVLLKMSLASPSIPV